MSRIVLDAELRKKLENIHHTVELTDERGRVIGRFVPVMDMADWEPLTPEASEEELDRREKSNDWLTTEEFLVHLENLKCSGSDGNEPC